MTAGPVDLNALPLDELYAELASDGSVHRLLSLARDEDLSGAGDLTSVACFADNERTRAHLVARQPGVIAGLAAMDDLIELFAPDAACRFNAKDGDAITRGSTLATITGPTRQVLALERTMLNLLSRLSGIATSTAAYVRAIRGAGESLPARLLDTRKTVPGLRTLSKYAVRCGGGYCHRVGLFDAVLIKDNHIAHLSPGDLREFVTRASHLSRELAVTPLRFIEVEVTSLDQLAVLLALPEGTIDFVLLDNMNCAMMKAAVEQRDNTAPHILLEASGGVTLDTIADIARTGVDRISVGAITHSSPALDLALDFA
ncbi:MAG: carboxylating nicotinate-nucleotide diphosphorylase [Phycisphaeraceae bacterium]|nr:carboxylating nicotinate-nucleotide diphosphorylase [Phycisphaerales bacterium]MCB9843269.1 carboxylating nicotinate-nucleotide diphosphorylase [Phycisphaeraceae bacterium]